MHERVQLFAQRIQEEVFPHLQRPLEEQQSSIDRLLGAMSNDIWFYIAKRVVKAGSAESRYCWNAPDGRYRSVTNGDASIKRADRP